MNDRPFTRRHPLSCWFSTMLSIFAGNILANFLLGEPIMIPFKQQDKLILATIVWYLMFYSPFDIVYHIFNFFPIKLLVMGAKEIYRCKNIYEGVSIAMKLYPQSYLIIVTIGTIKGVGSLVLRNFERSLRGMGPSSNELMQPTASTKLSLMVAIVFTLHKLNLILTQVPAPMLYLCVVTFMIYYRISVLIWDISDPFLPLENIFCTLFMGGIWDALQKALRKTSHRHKDGKIFNDNIKGQSTFSAFREHFTSSKKGSISDSENEGDIERENATEHADEDYEGENDGANRSRGGVGKSSSYAKYSKGKKGGKTSRDATNNDLIANAGLGKPKGDRSKKKD
ncbi:trimeric intracellular cation channel type 1B.1-like [Gordionus sp. m RMFG-2023]|uniref:trimeric intracellular cation channel type 1B.1-like n=1 Tax=Gordionus sp. m RMFG-2023 TaxID=3053472 RepID=UPI0031FD913A